MPPVKAYQIPDWANPANASVLDNWWTRTARTIGQFMGVNDPESQVMGLAAAPIDIPAADAAGAVKQTLRAYHGSPHDFERFDSSKIGTGEGAQAYGHGLYFAESQPTAAYYKDALSRQIADPRDGVNQIAYNWLSVPGGPRPMEAEDAHSLMADIDTLKPFADRKDIAQKIAQFVNGHHEIGGQISDEGWNAMRWLDRQLPTPPKGRMYEVNIHASPDELLDWDKPLSQQPPKVQEAIQKVAPNIERQAFTTHPLADGRIEIRSPIGGSMGYFQPHEVGEAIENFRAGYMGRGLGQRPLTGGDLIERAKQLNLPDISQQFKDAGIKGIQYLDQGSRAAGQGTRNFVIFDDKIIDIARKYGLSLPAAAQVYQAQQRLKPQPKGVE